MSSLKKVCSVGLRKEKAEIINAFWPRQLLSSGSRSLGVEWLVRVLEEQLSALLS